MWEPPFSGGFQGLWKGWDSFVVPRFPSGCHFHRGCGSDFCFVIGDEELTWSFLIAGLLAVGFDFRLALQILLCLDDRKSMTESLVLNDGCGVDSLILVEGAVGKHTSLETHLQPPVSEVIQVDVLAGKPFAELAAIQDDLPAVVMEVKLCTYVALLAMTQDVRGGSVCLNRFR